jgi:short-subunit dehydrogenase
MSAISISFNPVFFDWIKQSPVFRFILPGINKNKSGTVFSPPETKLSDDFYKHIPGSFIPKRECDYTRHKSNCRTGKTVLITGATSGIGREFAYNFARMGYDLIITGRRKNEIFVVASALRKKYGVRVDVILADLSERNDLQRLLRFIKNKKNIEVLVNNAGFGFSEKFAHDQINNQLKMLKVHVTAPLLLIHKVLPQMIRQRKGSIINVASLAAYAPNSANTMYTSTKSFLTNFTESLFMDLNQYGIRVQCLCPGFTQTDFHCNLTLRKDLVKNHFINWMDPADVVKYSLHCLETGKIICIPGLANRIIVSVISILPRRLYYFLIGRLSPKAPSHVKFKVCAQSFDQFI